MPAALSISTESPLASDADVLVLGVRSSDGGPALATDEPAFAAIAEALPRIGATGGADEVRRLPPMSDGGPAIALIGLGAPADGTAAADAIRSAAGSAARQLTGIRSLALALPDSDDAHVAAALEGAAIGAYAFHSYRGSSREAAKSPASTITVHTTRPPADPEGAVGRAHAVASAVHTVRDLVNTPPNDLYPASFADRVAGLAEGLPVEVEVLDEDALAEEGYGGILGVGRGSVRGPRLVVLRYSPEGATRHLSLVGKGITFDSGGLSLKPAASMVGMKYDMTGAATVLAVTLAAARLRLPVRVTARLCLAENLPSGSATRPNDVLRMYGGMTVEVLNTDAEGRLVLADGLVAASEERPDAIVDVATLTGAARVAMGERIVPVMGDDALVQRIIDAGRVAGEPMWHMPLPAELRSLLDSDVADIANAKPGNTAGGMLLAAHFLRAFVGRDGDGPDAAPIPWAHLDIAGAANNGGSPRGEVPKGPTGVTVRALLTLTEEFGRA